MFGAILETSGGAQTLAVTMVNRFGDKKAAWALGITGLVIAMPVFFDAGLIILIPLAFSLAKRTKRSTLYYVIPLLAGLAVGHAFIPPTPGPVLVATMLGVDLWTGCNHYSDSAGTDYFRFSCRCSGIFDTRGRHFGIFRRAVCGTADCNTGCDVFPWNKTRLHTGRT